MLMPTQAMIDLRRVSKRFGGMVAVDDVSLSVPRGEIAGLIGPNGAGKSTLFNVVAGTMRPSGGEIILQGRRVDGEPASRRLSRGLGRTFQIPRPFPAMTVLENVMTAAPGQTGERLLSNLLRRSAIASQERRIADRAMELLEFVTLDKLAWAPARSLSGGQRKLLELARVLMADAQIVLLDEPAAGVHPSLIEVIIERIAEINRRGVTFLIIEHNMALVARLCARVFVLAQGRLIAEGAPAEVVRDAAVIEAYLGGRPA
jgi:branched-chain amino acid transport system ATP-binding protein